MMPKIIVPRGNKNVLHDPLIHSLISSNFSRIVNLIPCMRKQLKAFENFQRLANATHLPHETP